MRTFAMFLLFALFFQGLLAGCVAKQTQPSALDPQYVDAQELKLKIRELADQLLSTTPNSGIADLVAMPTSFVNMNDKRQTSPLGNLFAESLIYEFNQRGFPVCEYRLTGNIDMLLGQGDFALLRQGVMSTVGKKWAALIVGTFYTDKDAVFVNARLVRASDGMVLRTGQLLLVKNALVTRLSVPLAPLAASLPRSGTSGTADAAGATVASRTPRDTAHGSLVSSGSMTIQPAPWRGTASRRNPGPGLWGTAGQ